MTKLFHSLDDWQQFRATNFFANKKIGFIPTMGNLHSGHESLLKRSVAENDISILSIFINPTQFNNANDLKNYPRTIEEDINFAKTAGVDFVLLPNYQEIYPDDYRYKVVETDFSQQLCGKFRPGHFDGVLTVVLKLLLLIKADFAYFGEKDFQQLQLITDMVKAFFLNTKIISCPTVRNENGLALSSRNRLLTKEQYALAPQFAKILNSDQPIENIKAMLSDEGFIVEYVEEHKNRRFAAVKLGEVRLIDNIALKIHS